MGGSRLMSQLEVNGKKLELNEEGFLTDPNQWDKQVAEALAKAAEGIENLTQEHWAIIEFIRNHFLETNLAPMVRSICKTTGLPLRRIYELFPSGPAKGACKVAGLPKPDGCV
jgi:TusE/DsrC/DsvC family sulfur relay protein